MNFSTFGALVAGLVIGYIGGVLTGKFLRAAIGLLLIMIVLGYIYLRYLQ